MKNRQRIETVDCELCTVLRSDSALALSLGQHIQDFDRKDIQCDELMNSVVEIIPQLARIGGVLLDKRALGPDRGVKEVFQASRESRTKGTAKFKTP